MIRFLSTIIGFFVFALVFNAQGATDLLPGTKSPRHRTVRFKKPSTLSRTQHVAENSEEAAKLIKSKRIIEAVEEACPWALRGGKVVGELLSKCALPLAVAELINEVGTTFIWGTPLADGTLSGAYALAEDPKKLKKRRDMAEYDSHRNAGEIPDEIKSFEDWIQSSKLTKSSGKKAEPIDELEYLKKGEVGVAFLHRPSGLVVKVILRPDQRRTMYDRDEFGEVIEMHPTARSFTRSEELAGRILYKMIQDQKIPAGIQVSPLLIIEDGDIMIGVKPFQKGADFTALWDFRTGYGEYTRNFRKLEELRQLRPFRSITNQNVIAVPGGIHVIDCEVMGERGHLVTSVQDLRRSIKMDPELQKYFSDRSVVDMLSAPHPLKVDPDLIQKFKYLVHQMIENGSL